MNIGNSDVSFANEPSLRADSRRGETNL